MMNWKQLNQQGQAVLLVLLVVAVALGFGLSIISQSTTELRISLHDQEAARAFNAAEAGIEEALKQISLGADQKIIVDGIEVNYTVSGTDSLEGVFKENETAQVFIAGTGPGSLTIEWIDSDNLTENPNGCIGATAESGGTAASLLITVVDDNDQISQQVGINACSLNGDNNMTDVSDSGLDGFLRSYDLVITGSDAYARIRPIYNQASLRVTSDDVSLPNQTFIIDSTAQAPALETKAIKVTRSEPATPSIFDYVLFSGTNLSK